jgi:Trypsin-like peptidase domain
LDPIFPVHSCLQKAQSGDGAMRQCLFSILVLIATSAGIEASCIDPSTLAHSTVSLTREFSEEERKATPEVLGIRGTGWFISSRRIVTAAHVADAMHLSTNDWKEIEIRESESKWSIATRIHRLVGPHSEKMAILELGAAFPGATILPIRTEPLVPEERVVSIAYPNNRLRFAEGRFVEFGADARFTGSALLEMHDGNDRLVLDHGASGAPVLDCRGRVVAVVSTAITQTISFLSPAMRTSTAWQTPNVISIPIEALNDLRRSD